METEDNPTTREKRLPYHLLVTGILAFCLILSVATTHLDAQPRGRNLAGIQQIDSRRLDQILTKIEQRLTALEKQRVSRQASAPAMRHPGPPLGHQASIESRVTALEQKVSQQPTAPATNQMGSSPDLTTIEARLTVLENQAGSPQPAAPATEQTGSDVGELTCTKLTVVNSQGQPIFIVSDNGFGGSARLYGAGGQTIFEVYLLDYGPDLMLSNPDGASYVQIRAHTAGGVLMAGSSDGTGRVTLDAGQTAGEAAVKVSTGVNSNKELGLKDHTH